MTAAASTETGLTNRRHGRNRQLVLDVLDQAGRPMRAYELLKALHKDGLRSPLQVYRALEQLVEGGVVHKIESLSAFALCTHAKCTGDGHAAFAICTQCGRAEEFHDPALERALRRLAKRGGFRTSATTVELSGLCENCTNG